MFKRISKKQEKQKLNEELGEDFQMQDTDSDESSSESGSASGSGSALEDSDLEEYVDAEDGGDIQTEFLGGGDEDSEDDSDEEGLNLENEPPMTVDEAVQNPIYLPSMQPEIRTCITCPNKKLKNNDMVEIHLKSSAHVRRHQRFCKLIQSKESKAKDPREIAAALDKQIEPVAVTPEGLTRRGLKRKLAREQIIKKRTVQKEIIKRKRLEKLEKKQDVERGKELKDAAKALTPKKKRKLEDLTLEEAAPKVKLAKTKSKKHKKTEEAMVIEANGHDMIDTEPIAPSATKSHKKKSKTTEATASKANDDIVVDANNTQPAATKPHKKKKAKTADAPATTGNDDSPTIVDEHNANSRSDNLRTEKKSKRAKKVSLAPPSDKPKKARYFEVDGDIPPTTAEPAKSKEGKKPKKSKKSGGTDEQVEGKKRRKKEPKGLQIFE